MLSLFRSSSIAPARRAFSTSIANNVARVSLIGFLPLEPEVATLPDGRELVRYIVGVSRGIDKGSTWFKVTNFDPEGRGGKEYLATLPKGTRVFVEGDLSLTTYKGTDEKSHYFVNVIQRSITCLYRPKPKPTEAEGNQVEEASNRIDQ